MVQSETRSSSVIHSVFAVLRCFTSDEPLQGVTEIAGQVGLHKSSVSRLLATLEDEGVVERDEESRKFRLGVGLIGVAGPLLANLDVRRVALPVLRDLSQESGETAALVVWSGTEAVTVEQVPSPHQVKHTNPLGTPYRSVQNASVRALLAHLPPAQALHLCRERVVAVPRSFDEAAFGADLADIREVGYAVNYGLTSPDEVGIAAAVIDHRGEVAGAVILAAPLYRVPAQDVPRLARHVVRSATDIGARLGRPTAAPTSERATRRPTRTTVERGAPPSVASAAAGSAVSTVSEE